MTSDVVKNIGNGYKTVKNLFKCSAIAGDVASVYLMVTGELPRYFISAANKGIETLKYTLNNNPEAIKPLTQVVAENTGEIALLTWLTGSVFLTGYWIIKGMKSEE